jgi:hypothetical protein
MRSICGFLLYQRVYAVRPQTRCVMSEMDNKSVDITDRGYPIL